MENQKKYDVIALGELLKMCIRDSWNSMGLRRKS